MAHRHRKQQAKRRKVAKARGAYRHGLQEAIGKWFPGQFFSHWAVLGVAGESVEREAFSMRSGSGTELRNLAGRLRALAKNSNLTGLLLRVEELDISLPDVVERVRKGTRFTVIYRSRPAFQIVPVDDQGDAPVALAADTLYRAQPVGSSDDGRSSVDHDAILYPR